MRPKSSITDMRKLLLSIAIAIVLGAGLSACSQSAAESAASAEADAALAVETVQIKRGDMVRVFSGTATLAAERAANLVSENGGEVLNMVKCKKWLVAEAGA